MATVENNLQVVSSRGETAQPQLTDVSQPRRIEIATVASRERRLLQEDTRHTIARGMVDYYRAISRVANRADNRVRGTTSTAIQGPSSTEQSMRSFLELTLASNKEVLQKVSSGTATQAELDTIYDQVTTMMSKGTPESARLQLLGIKCAEMQQQVIQAATSSDIRRDRKGNFNVKNRDRQLNRNVQINGIPISDVQIELLNQIEGLSFLPDMGFMTETATQQVNQRLIEITKARVDFYQTFGRELRLKEDWNLVRMKERNNMFPNVTTDLIWISDSILLDGIGINGTTEVGLGRRGISIEQQLGTIMDQLNQDTSRMVTDLIAGQAGDSIADQIQILESRKVVQRDDAQLARVQGELQTAKTRRDGDVPKHERLSTIATQVGPLAKEIQALEEDPNIKSIQAIESGTGSESIAEAKSALAAIVKSNNDPITGILHLEAHLSSIQYDISRLTEELEKFDSRAIGLLEAAKNPKIQSASVYIDALIEADKQKTILRTRIGDRNSGLQQEFIDAETKIRIAKAQQAQAQNELDSRKTTLATLKADASIKAKLDALQQKRTALQQLQSEQAQLRTEINGVSIDDLNRQIAQLEEEEKKYSGGEDPMVTLRLGMYETLQKDVIAQGKMNDIGMRVIDDLQNGVEVTRILDQAQLVHRGVDRDYLRAIYIMGGQDVLASTAQGRALYQKYTQLLSPDTFALLQAQYTSGVSTVRNIRFTGDAGLYHYIISTLVQSGVDGTLGELANPEMQRRQDIANTEAMDINIYRQEVGAQAGVEIGIYNITGLRDQLVIIDVASIMASGLISDASLARIIANNIQRNIQANTLYNSVSSIVSYASHNTPPVTLTESQVMLLLDQLVPSHPNLISQVQRSGTITDVNLASNIARGVRMQISAGASAEVSIAEIIRRANNYTTPVTLTEAQARIIYNDVLGTPHTEHTLNVERAVTSIVDRMPRSGNASRAYIGAGMVHILQGQVQQYVVDQLRVNPIPNVADIRAFIVVRDPAQLGALDTFMNGFNTAYGLAPTDPDEELDQTIAFNAIQGALVNCGVDVPTVNALVNYVELVAVQRRLDVIISQFVRDPQFDHYDNVDHLTDMIIAHVIRSGSHVDIPVAKMLANEIQKKQYPTATPIDLATRRAQMGSRPGARRVA
ncbi:MAG: hypothetical protein WCO06_05820 [Candidatus Roizmanbacteria bacterium]